MNLGAITRPEFQNLIRNPKSVIFDKLNNGKPIEIGGIPVDKAKALELVTLPSGFNAFNSLVESFRNSRPGWNSLLGSVDIEENELIIKQSVIDADIEAGKTYATTDEEKRCLIF